MVCFITLVSSGFFQVSNSFRVDFSKFPTRFEWIFPSFTLVSSFQELPNCRWKTWTFCQVNCQTVSVAHLLHSFRVCFISSPLVSSVFHIFSTRFECNFRCWAFNSWKAKGDWRSSSRWFDKTWVSGKNKNYTRCRLGWKDDKTRKRFGGNLQSYWTYKTIYKIIF